MIKPRFTHRTLCGGMMSVALAFVAAAPAWADGDSVAGVDPVVDPIFPAKITVGDATYTVELTNDADTLAGLNITGYTATGTEFLIPAEIAIPTDLHAEPMTLPVTAVSLPVLDKTYAVITIEKANEPLTVNTNLAAVTKATTLNLNRNIVNGQELSSAFGGFGNTTSSITNVNFDNSITAIPDSTFNNCQRIRAIKLPDSLEHIGNYGFANIRGLATLVLPEKLQTIGDHAFYNSQRLTSVEFTSTAEHVGSNAFGRCENIDSMYIRANNVGASVVDQCTKLTALYIEGNGILSPAAVSSCPALNTLYLDFPIIGDGSSQPVAACDSLKNIIFGDNVQELKSNAFKNIGAIESIRFGTGVKSVGQFAFYNTNPTILNIFFASAPKDDPQITLLGAYGLNTFSTVSYVSQITFGNRMKSVGDRVFARGKCDLGNTIQSIGTNNNLMVDTVPASLTSVGAMGISRCRYIQYAPAALTWAVAFNGEKLIDRYDSNKVALEEGAKINRTINVKQLTQTSIPRQKGQLFESNYGVEFGTEGEGKIDLDTKLVAIGLSDYSKNQPFFYIGSNVRSMYSYAIYMGGYFFKNPASYFEIGEGVENMYGSCILFGGRNYPEKNSLSVVLPGSLRIFYDNAIPSSMYYHFDNLNVILKSGQGELKIIPSGNNNSIFEYATDMYIDRNIADLEIDNSHSSKIQYPKLQNVVFGDNVRRVGANLFNGCTTLERVIMSDSVRIIGADAFRGCAGLKILSMAETLENIEDGAYTDCTGFERIVARGTVPPIGSAGFGTEVEENVPLYVPSAVVGDYQDSDLFFFFNHIKPFGQDVAVDVIVKEEEPEVAEVIEQLDEAEEGTNITMPSGGDKPFYFLVEMYAIPEDEYQNQFNAKAKSVRKASDVSDAEPRLYWMSTDPSVASVDQEGSVTINKKAPVEIRAYLLDGSDKYVTFGVNQPALLGDINRDKIVNSADINMIIDHVTAPEGSTVKLKVADMNGDGEINAADINMLIQQCSKTEE